MEFERLNVSEAQALRSRARENRRRVDLPAHLVCGNGEITSVEVLDLSYDGCNVGTPVELKVGEKTTLGISGLGSHDAQVRWYRDGKAGLAFTIDKIVEREFVERGQERIQLSAEISLRRVGRKHYVARIFDLSNYGCKVEFVERPRLDELVWVKLNFLEAIEAKVCWVDGFHGGLKFLRPIYPAVFDLLVARLTADSRQ